MYCSYNTVNGNCHEALPESAYSTNQLGVTSQNFNLGSFHVWKAVNERSSIDVLEVNGMEPFGSVLLLGFTPMHGRVA